MNFQEPYRIHQVDFNNIVYNKVKTSDSKKIIFIKYQDKNKQKPFVIQCPTLLNINNAYKITDEYHELEIPIITQEKNKNQIFIDFLEDLDQRVISDAKSNSKLWFDEVTNKSSIRYKKIVKESDSYKDGVLRLKIIKNVDFETLLQIDNKKRITIKEIPCNSWCKMLLEIYAIVINYQNNSFYIFLRPIILSFKEKESVNYNYTFLEDSDSDKGELDIPDSELHSLFIKNTNKIKNDNLTSSQIIIVDNNKTFSESSSTTSSLENETKNTTENVRKNIVDIINKDRLSSSSSNSDEATSKDDDIKKNNNDYDVEKNDKDDNLKQNDKEDNLKQNDKEDNLKKNEEESNFKEHNVEENNEKLEKEFSKLNTSSKINTSSTSSEKIRLTDSSSISEDSE
jgi:hypothetical protein